MGITSSNKEINSSQIRCGGTFRITLALSAAPDISENPTDIVLVLDRSGSMAGSPLANLKLGVFFASTFWRKMQNIFGECCISKLEKVARPRLAAILPAT